jgi:hypothetical protein
MAAAVAYDDEDPFCSVCKQKEDAEHMLLCSTCNTGNHTHCLGLPGVPAGDYYCNEGCKCQLALLQPGCTVVVEVPQPLYADEKQPHLSQALSCNSIISIGDINLSDLGAFRDIKALCNKAPIRDSVRMYSVVHPHQQLKRLHWEVCKPVQQLYMQQGAEVCTYRLVSSRFRAFGTLAAVQGSSTEAWVAGSSAAQLAMEDLVATGPPAVRKKHRSASSSSAGQVGGSMQQSHPQDASSGQQDEVDTTATVNQQPSPVSATTGTRLRPRKPAPVQQYRPDESADSDGLGEDAVPTQLQQQGLAATPEAAVSLQPAAGLAPAQQQPMTLLEQLLQLQGSAAAAGVPPGQPTLLQQLLSQQVPLAGALGQLQTLQQLLQPPQQPLGVQLPVLLQLLQPAAAQPPSLLQQLLG